MLKDSSNTLGTYAHQSAPCNAPLDLLTSVDRVSRGGKACRMPCKACQCRSLFSNVRPLSSPSSCLLCRHVPRAAARRPLPQLPRTKDPWGHRWQPTRMQQNNGPLKHQHIVRCWRWADTWRARTYRRYAPCSGQPRPGTHGSLPARSKHTLPVSTPSRSAFYSPMLVIQG